MDATTTSDVRWMKREAAACWNEAYRLEMRDDNPYVSGLGDHARWLARRVDFWLARLREAGVYVEPRELGGSEYDQLLMTHERDL